MDIHEFLALPHRFRWGGVGTPHPADPQQRCYNDCMTFCSSWILANHGVDPAAESRGTYSTELGAARLIAKRGGAVPLMAHTLEPLGFIRTTDPQTGDVGIIKAISEIDRRPSEMAAIRFGPLWAVLSLAGVRATKVDFVAAWRSLSEVPLRERS